MTLPRRRRLKRASRGQTSAGSSPSWGAWTGTARPTRGTRWPATCRCASWPRARPPPSATRRSELRNTSLTELLPFISSIYVFAPLSWPCLISGCLSQSHGPSFLVVVLYCSILYYLLLCCIEGCLSQMPHISHSMTMFTERRDLPYGRKPRGCSAVVWPLWESATGPGPSAVPADPLLQPAPASQAPTTPEVYPDPLGGGTSSFLKC